MLASLIPRTIIDEVVHEIQEVSISIREVDVGDVSGVVDRIRIAEAAVVDYPPALQLLTELNSTGLLVLRDLQARLNLDLLIAVGLLAAAQFCEIDGESLRITGSGVDFIRELAL